MSATEHTDTTMWDIDSKSRAKAKSLREVKPGRLALMIDPGGPRGLYLMATPDEYSRPRAVDVETGELRTLELDLMVLVMVPPYVVRGVEVQP